MEFLTPKKKGLVSQVHPESFEQSMTGPINDFSFEEIDLNSCSTLRHKMSRKTKPQIKDSNLLSKEEQAAISIAEHQAPTQDLPLKPKNVKNIQSKTSLEINLHRKQGSLDFDSDEFQLGNISSINQIKSFQEFSRKQNFFESQKIKTGKNGKTNRGKKDCPELFKNFFRRESEEKDFLDCSNSEIGKNNSLAQPFSQKSTKRGKISYDSLYCHNKFCESVKNRVNSRFETAPSLTKIELKKRNCVYEKRIPDTYKEVRPFSGFLREKKKKFTNFQEKIGSTTNFSKTATHLDTSLRRARTASDKRNNIKNNLLKKQIDVKKKSKKILKGSNSLFKISYNREDKDTKRLDKKIKRDRVSRNCIIHKKSQLQIAKSTNYEIKAENSQLKNSCRVRPIDQVRLAKIFMGLNVLTNKNGKVPVQSFRSLFEKENHQILLYYIFKEKDTLTLLEWIDCFSKGVNSSNKQELCLVLDKMEIFLKMNLN